ncbi:unnamed protein product, partial [Natator depressus]
MGTCNTRFLLVNQRALYKTKVEWISLIKSASEVANSMYKTAVQCGCPQRILTDLGPEFNKFNLYIGERLGIKRSFTSPYHPQTNGLAGNANKSIKG